ncbi:efflux RND transporter periplasmic adaptor subunit, partial [candidate division KSB1 bacterium]|nr:efflux RND transporter periplasmic adaptor subunit [candidate division KSB1 bacterium]
MKNVKYPIIFTAMLLMVWVLYCGSKKQQDVAPSAIAVKTANVNRQSISIPIHASGILSAESQMKLAFKTGGIVEKILVNEGETVRKDQILATLMLDEINARVNQAQSALEKAQRDYDRVTNLYADSVVTLEQKQNMETALKVAQSNMQMASFNLKYSVIRAPSDGKILKRLVEPNEMVDTGYPVFVLGSTSGGWVVKTGLVDKDIVRVQMGDSVTVTFDPYPGVAFSGRITELAGAADPLHGTYEIEMSLEHTKFTLLSGFIAQIRIFPARLEQLYLIPIESLVEAQGTSGYVFSIENGHAVKIPVSIGHVFED